MRFLFRAKTQSGLRTNIYLVQSQRITKHYTPAPKVSL